MKRTLLLAGLTALAFAACSPKQPTQEAMKQEIVASFNDIAQRNNIYDIKPEEASRLASLSLQYAERFPEDSLAPIFLSKSSLLALISGFDCDTSVMLCDRIIDQYSDYPELYDVYLRKAQILEQAERYEAANETYIAFIEKYPEDQIAMDLRIHIIDKGLGALSNEEQLDAILSNNQ